MDLKRTERESEVVGFLFAEKMKGYRWWGGDRASLTREI
jgi:hypothetical protein